MTLISCISKTYVKFIKGITELIGRIKLNDINELNCITELIDITKLIGRTELNCRSELNL